MKGSKVYCCDSNFHQLCLEKMRKSILGMLVLMIIIPLLVEEMKTKAIQPGEFIAVYE